MARQREQLPGLEDPADERTVEGLVAFGYKREAVGLWPRSKAVTVLEAERKQWAVVSNKRNRDEGRPEGPVPAGPAGERADAAEYLTRALAFKGAGELHLALSYCCFALADDEARRLAEHMAKKFREGP